MIFLLISLFLSFGIISFPSVVIGDNFLWTQQTLNDILGFRVIRETYMGDIAILSTFKSGFLLPVSLLFDLVSLPISLIYPFLFYFLSLLSFYFLAREFLEDKSILVLVSVLYVINPITPYYYASLLNAFSLIFLPLGMKFFIKSLRDVELSKHSKLFKNFAFTAIFLSLTVSAQEQFFLSSLLIAVFFIGTFMTVWYQKFGFTISSLKRFFLNIGAFVSSFLMVNLPLIISVINVQSAQLSSYFAGGFYDFLDNVNYTYSTADITNLLRLGGDSGVGLGNTAWYDSNLISNIFGYVLFGVFIVSIYLLIRNRYQIRRPQRIFFLMNIFLYFTVITLILLIRSLPMYPDLANSIFTILLQTWENPIKLRVLLLLSSLVTSLFFFMKIEKLRNPLKKKIVKWGVLIIIIFSTLIYNSPWLINYVGQTPIKQVANNLEWGELYDPKLSDLSKVLENKYSDARGVIIPYTHKIELYSPSNFRIFQLISTITNQLSSFVQDSPVSWSQLLGLVSAKYIVLRNDFKSGEHLIFPLIVDQKIASSLEEIKNSENFNLIEEIDNYLILENKNALPTLYATNYFVFYDDPNTLKYSMQLFDLKNLPVFIQCSNITGQLSLPSFIEKGPFNLTAFSFPYDNNPFNVTVTLIRNGIEKPITLNQTQSSEYISTYSSIETLEPDDIIIDPNSETWTKEKQINQLILDSNTLDLGTYESFTLNFTGQVLSKGEYSFHSPRIILDSGEQKYFIILHTDGRLEISLLADGIYTPGLINRYIGYNLENQDSYVDVSVSRTFCDVQVYIDGKLAVTFPTNEKKYNLTISSEQSISRFENIDLQSRNILRLNAARQVIDSPTFTVQNHNPDTSSLTINTNESQFIVVSQYLKTELSKIENNDSITDIEANIFFKGWIINMADQNSTEVEIEIKTDRSNLTIGLTIFSIIATYLVLVFGILHVDGKLYYKFKKLYFRMTRTNGQKESPCV